MKMEIELPTDDILEVEFEYIKIEKHCFTCFSLFHEENLGIIQSIALQRIEAEKKRHDDRRGYTRPDDHRPPNRSADDSYFQTRRGENRAVSGRYQARRENSNREQSILSRTARSNPAHYRNNAPEMQYRVVERSRQSSGSSTPLHDTRDRPEGREIRGSIPNISGRALPIPLIGLSGGLALLWNDDTDITVLESSPNLIDTRVDYKGTTSFVSFIYGPPATEDRPAFWSKLSSVGRGRDEPWLITGDFNDILTNAEKMGGPTRPEVSFNAFRSFHTGEKLSWRGHRHTHFIRSRLDRSMGNCSWSEAFPMGRCRYLRFEGSDHRPLLSYFNADRPTKRGLFRFNRSLTEQNEVTQLVSEAWNSSPLATVIAKLNTCRRSIIKWAKEKQEQSNLTIKRNQEALEAALSSDTPDTTLIETLNIALLRAYIAEEQFWQQRSRIQWLKQGDRNTGFFHAATRTRRIINSIPVIEDPQGGAVYEEPDISRLGMQAQGPVVLVESSQAIMFGASPTFQNLTTMSLQR
ncbi:hypothetical protein Bca52824_028003 [Brassica carinata]|uniref:Endonuclease/exonuclease/phosphatase domain-containing protein n=1 Tax=Brassica carinata TaxID=52824 RepID=A0A8X7VBH6_BRACI|nr:hypothetical protein Bca52824_028003 [Brassica carinata]